MRIFLNRTLPDSVLSRFRIRDMRHDEDIIVECENVAEYNSALRNARSEINSANREDGFMYRMEHMSRDNKIKISLHKPDEA